MIFRIEWVENKGEGWKVATLLEAIEGGKTFENVSINKVDKSKVLAFPAFDSFAPGSTVEGDLWTNPAGRTYLFAPKPKTQNTANKGGMTGMKAAQERKAENIKEAQENKGHAIKVSAAMRDATLFTVALMERDSDMAFKEVFAEIKNWYLKEWSNTEKQVDVPFN